MVGTEAEANEGLKGIGMRGVCQGSGGDQRRFDCSSELA